MSCLVGSARRQVGHGPKVGMDFKLRAWERNAVQPISQEVMNYTLFRNLHVVSKYTHTQGESMQRVRKCTHVQEE